MIKKISIISTSIISLGFLYSCSSSQQQAQTQEAIANENAESAPEEEVAENDSGEYAEEELINPGNSATINNAESTNEFASSDTSAPLIDPPAENPAALPADQGLADQAMATPATTGVFASGGNVMYASQQVYGYATAAEGATPTCTLEKGDHPLLQQAGEWGQIKADQHVKLQEMSQPAVPRDRTPSAWH